MIAVATLLDEGRRALSEAGQGAEDNPRLDAELLLAEVLGRDRVWLRAWPEAAVEPAHEQHYRTLLARRAAGEPIAYLLGCREFWSLPLEVAPGVLIPRPDTERLVELALQLGPPGPAQVLDLGTGSGAIALALASERPLWQLTGIDIDAGNTALAAANARRLGLANVVHFINGCWLEPVGAQFDLIVANPPYIAADDPHLTRGDVRFEPRRALVADDDGLADLKTIIEAAPRTLCSGGWLLLEHGWQQGAAVVALLRTRGFAAVACWQDDAGRDRVSGGRWMGLEAGEVR